MLDRDPDLISWRQSAVQAEYYFNLRGQAKERTRDGHHSAINTRNWERLIADATREQRTESIPDVHQRLGARILYRFPSRVGDVDNYLKSLFDGMQHVAYANDSQFDYVELVRQVYEGRPLIEVELLTRDF